MKDRDAECYRYSHVYSTEDNGYRFRQAVSEGSSEFLVMERSVDELLECERDRVQVLLGDVLE
jgi:hypothetical protein